MRVNNNKTSYNSRFKFPALGFSILAVTLVFFGNPIRAQSVKVDVIHELAFGSFATGATGGTVEVSPNGVPAVTGTVIGLAQLPVSAAEFEVTVSGNDRIVNFILPQSAQLTRSGGNGFMTITNFNSDKPGNSFVTTKDVKTFTVKVGATLNVQNSTVNPPGNYNGTFTVTFIRD